MYDLKNMQLMGGHQIIEGIRPVTDKPIECHFYTRECDRLFIEKIAAAGCNMLILPAEHFIGAPLAYIMNYCHEFDMKLGLTLGCYTPLTLTGCKSSSMASARLTAKITGIGAEAPSI